jgi:hypothetical protein
MKVFITTAVFLLAAFAATPSLAQLPDRLKERLRSSAEFTDEDIEKLAKGETVIREVKRSSRRDVALVGAVKLDYPFEIAEKGLSRTVETQKRRSSKETGSIEDPPKKKNSFEQLVFDEGDLADLKNCRVGDCEWNLSDGIITALRKIDWDAPDAGERASRLLKQMLVEYVRDYALRGEGALMTYADTDVRVSLAEEYRIGDGAPAFARFVRSYPREELSGATSVFDWSVVKIGLKPVLMINHTMSFGEKDGEGQRRFSVSRQIFANHYFDASLTIAMLVGVPSAGGGAESYLLFASRSRASALRGKLAGLLRGMIEDQAKGKLESFLEDTKKYTALAAANADAALEREATREAADPNTTLRGIFYIAVPVLAVALGVFVFLLMRKRAG